MALTPTTFAPPSFSAVRWLGNTFLHVVETPSVWLNSFFDSAEDLWATDPLLSDDDEQPFISPY